MSVLRSKLALNRRLLPAVALSGALLVLACGVGGCQDGMTQEGTSLPYRTSIYFAPGTNLERVDIPLIESARTSLDIAMYTFTDRNIADAVAGAARRGVHVRIYRDRDQYASEQYRGGQVTAILAGQRNIQIRVKASSELMHEKAFEVDGRVLRDGSGNWSPSAARYQDNEITVTNDPLEAAGFSQNFNRMWNRTDNEAAQ